VVVGFAKEAGGSAGGVAHAFADAGVGDFDHGPDEGAGGVVFAPVAPGIAHAFDLFFVEGGELVLLLLGAKLEGVDEFEGIAQGVTALELVADFAEDFTDLVLDTVWAFGPALKGAKVGDEALVYKVDQVGSGKSGVVIEGTGGILRSSPGGPAVLGIENGGVGLTLQSGLHGPGIIKIIQVFEKEQPRGLLDVIELR